MKILVCGGREYADIDKVYEVLDRLHEQNPITMLVHGAARGADSLADAWAVDNSVPQDPIAAEWNRYRNYAGPIRNREMVIKHRDITLVVAFPGGSGTRDMIKVAAMAGITVMEVRA